MRKLILLLLLMASPCFGVNRYIDDDGTDSGDCTNSGSPCRTFSYSLNAARFNVGDTLIVKDGTYTTATNGSISLSSRNCTALAPCTIEAENERAAFISSDGGSTPAINIVSSSHWVIHGLRVRSADLCVGGSNYTQCTNTGNDGVVRIYTSNNITLRRLLVHNNNRFLNQHLIIAHACTSILIEECEGYFAHRGGFVFSGSTTNSTMRRCYLHSRSYADIANGYPTTGIDGNKGDEGFTVYPGDNNTIENCISEGWSDGYLVQADNAGVNGNHILGSIANSNTIGYLITTKTTQVNQNTVVKDSVGMASTTANFWDRAGRNNRFDNVTALNATSVGIGILADRPSPGNFGTAPYSWFSDNALAFGNLASGINVNTTTGPTTWLVDYALSNSNSPNFSPSSHANLTNSSTAAHGMGSCKLWIPASATNLKGTGKNSLDRGANILYRTVNRVLTYTPLWDTSTNDFTGCGVVVAGVNDSAGNSCTNVDIRLSVGTANGCAFPDGYGAGPSSGGPWVATDNFDSYSDGELNGLNGGSGWSAAWSNTNLTMTVAAAPTGGQGGKAILNNADANAFYHRAFSNLTAGVGHYKFWASSTNMGDRIFVSFGEGLTERCMSVIGDDGFFKIWDGSSQFAIAPYTAQTWHDVDMRFDDVEQPNLCSARLNNGVWSQWFPAANGGSYTNINRFSVQTQQNSTFTGQVYIDDIRAGSEAVIVSTIALVDAGIAGTMMFPGEVKPLQWQTTDYTGNINIEVSRDGGVTFQRIAIGVPDTGTYNWTVTGPATTDARIRTCLANNTAVCDTSQAFGIGGTLLTIR